MTSTQEGVLFIKRKMPRQDGLAARMATAALLLHAERIRVLLSKANFNPNQPRVPRGDPHGGRWVDGDAGGEQDDGTSPGLLVSDDGGLPDLPEKRPQSARARHGIARAIVRYLRETHATYRLAIWVARAAWLADEAARDITTYFDEPKPLDELRDAADDPKKGYDIHHIVEQGPARQDGFSEAKIQSRLNKIRIPRFKHWEINGWYGQKNERFGGLSPRDYLRGRSWEERYSIGLDALRDQGVLSE